MNSISDYQQMINNWYYSRSYTAELSDNEDVEQLTEIALSDTGSMGGNGAVQPLDELVAAGTITEEQEEEIKKAIESAMQSSSYSRYKIQSNYAAFADPLDSLVEEGIITAEQRTAVKDVLEASKPEKMPPPSPMPSADEDDNSIESILDSLIAAGEITEEQKSSIIEALQSAYNPYPADGDMLWNRDNGNRGAAFFSNRIMPVDDEFQSMVRAYETQFEAVQYDEIQDSLQTSL